MVDAAETYRLVDEIPAVAELRQQERAAAQATIAERRALQERGEINQIPLPIDALSTAEIVIRAKHEHGGDSEIYKERFAGLRLDTSRLVAEWFRKLRPEYFRPVRHIYDEETEDFYSHGYAIGQMTHNALTPIPDDPEEEGRRVNERVEDATPRILKKVGGFTLAQAGVRIRTISECTDKAIRDYRHDIAIGAPHTGYNGYVPEIEKVMVRDIRLDEASGDRLEEQIGLPGIYINHYVIQKALGHRGAKVGHMDKTELHGSQMLVHDDLIEFVQLLDDIASEEWGQPIFMGEIVGVDYVKDYASIRQEAYYRQEGLSDMVGTAVTFILDLVEDQVSKQKAPAMVEAFVKKMLLERVKEDNSLATQIFDEKTAVGLREVAYLESIGQYEEAFARFQEVELSAPGGGYCNGGSCGLESVNKLSEEGKELMKDLKAEAGDTIVKDKERSCRCGKKTIVYAYNENKVNKYCTSCKAFESKKSKVGSNG